MEDTPDLTLTYMELMNSLRNFASVLDGADAGSGEEAVRQAFHVVAKMFASAASNRNAFRPSIAESNVLLRVLQVGVDKILQDGLPGENTPADE